MLFQAGDLIENETETERFHRLADDPRADLEGDHELWLILLGLAYHLDGHDSRGLFMALHGLRCLGAALAWQEGKGGAYLALTRGELSEAEYAADRRRWLVPRAAEVKVLLERTEDKLRQAELIHA